MHPAVAYLRPTLKSDAAVLVVLKPPPRKQEHVNVLDANKQAPHHAWTSNSVMAPDYAKEAQEFNCVALNKLMNTSYVQNITNYLHDTFCADGLEVELPRAAREAIYDLIAGLAAGKTVPSSQEIEDLSRTGYRFRRTRRVFHSRRGIHSSRSNA